MATADSILDVIAGWSGRQRWFGGKSSTPRLSLVGLLELLSDPDKRIVTYLVRDEGEHAEVLYQVPVVYRREPLPSLHHAALGILRDENGQVWHLYDGPHDPDFAELLLTLITTSSPINGENASARGVAFTDLHCRVVNSRVLDGEQSNSSIIYSVESTGEDGNPREHQLICKVFRVLHHGDNPDVVLQSALFAAGSSSVPESVGCLEGEWPDDSAPGERARGHLAFAQEFLAGAADAWRLALTFASEGKDFTGEARAMGVATADIHSTLAEAMSTSEASRLDIERTSADWLGRMVAALTEVPELGVCRDAIVALFARATSVPWPRLQRIHGDLHLGQVLHLPDGTWAIIDFEGEPLRPLAERSHLDVPLRDVAGMLRSFSYVAGALPDAPGVLEWAGACRSAFLDGYSERADLDVRVNPVLLDAFELDKALYETVYEARNRPSWLSVPVAAVRRLADKASRSSLQG